MTRTVTRGDWTLTEVDAEHGDWTISFAGQQLGKFSYALKDLDWLHRAIDAAWAKRYDEKENGE